MNPRTRRRLLVDATQVLAPVAGDMAKREGRWLLEAASGRDGAALLAVLDDVPLATETEVFEGFLRRRAAGEPLQYVLGEAPFLRRMFHVGPGVLIPRPETELLAERALGGLASAPAHAAVLDVGTGSGCLAVTLAAERPHICVEAWDVSREALTFARRNAERHGVRVTFLQRDVLDAGSPSQPVSQPALFHLIVSNPPYIHDGERALLHPSVVDFEPDVALFAAGDALVFYRALAVLGRQRLHAGGSLFVEIHADRGADVTSLLEKAGYVDVRCLPDQFGRDRIVEARQGSSAASAAHLSPNQTGR